ncbi:MAG TPA: TIGR04282 family arsenosugar biosynthesis glycosyltransferase [Candidatus Polarisedimenticolia bacterium]|nr:TIGR04282 family arsenosugar biosynthesis glycosyltransferase [Candidatus Polarisedimenticolia bacterium]
MPARDRTLALFARTPRLGRVKTRLTPPFTAEEALALHQALLADSCELLRRTAAAAGASIRLYLDEGTTGNLRVPEGCELRRQEGADLGERLRRAFEEELETGARRVVVIGSDSPHLPVAWLQRAFTELERQDLVIGPARDGGYYLLGAGRVHPFLFEGIPWGSSQVYRETVRRARREGLAIASLPALDDVDVAESVGRLFEELMRRKSEGDSELPETTFRLLREWEERGRISRRGGRGAD